MKRMAFLCRTPIHVFRTIQLKFDLFYDCCVDVFIFDSFRGSGEIVERIRAKNVFDKVFFVHDSDYMYHGKCSDLVSYLKKSLFKEWLNEDKYDELFAFDIFGQFNEIAFNVLKKNNTNLIYNMMEDGPALYYVGRVDSNTKKYLFKFFGLKNSLDYIDYWWFSRPDLMSIFGKGEKKEIPKVNKKNTEMIQYINYVFDYKDSEDIRCADIMFMEECFYNDGLLKTNKDLDTYRAIQGSLTNTKCVVKLHPRSSDNRFEKEFKVLKNNGIPWELYALNMDTSKKIMVSIACTTMVSSSMIFGEESYSIMLVPMFVNDIIEVKTQTPYFTAERLSKLKDHAKIYNDKNKFKIVSSFEEAIKIIKDWRDEIRAYSKE